MDAILDGCTQCGKGHASTGKFTLVTQGSGGQPHGGQAADSKEGSQSVRVELVGLVDVAHHELGLGGVCQQREATCGFDLVCDPVPIADALKSDGSSTRQLGEKGRNGSGGVIDANSIEHLATGVLELKLRVVFVSITADRKCLHDIPPRGHRARLNATIARKEALLYYQIVAVVP